MDVKLNFSEKLKRDYKLVCLARDNNDQQAYKKLMKLYEGAVNFTMLKMTNNCENAEDLTQEAFEKAFLRLSTYEPDYCFSTWLFKIAINNCIDFIRKSKKNNIISQSFYYDNDEMIEITNKISSTDLNPEEKLIKEQKIEKIHDRVANLTPHYRNLIELRYFRERSYEEISTLLQLPLGTVKAQLFRARELLYRSMRKSEKVN
jgi:RNA polymerase sigma factor (sigma-70 family)